MPSSYGRFFIQIYVTKSVLLYRYFCSTSAGCHSATLALKKVVEIHMSFCRYDEDHGKKLFKAFYESQYTKFSMPGVERLSEY